MTDIRQDIVDWAKWGVANNANFIYTEGPQRMDDLAGPVPPVTCDCSAFVTYCHKWSGAADPNGQGYNGTGYTGTLLSHGKEIPLAQVIPGDVIVYGPGTGWHTALVVEAGADPLTVSHGQQGDPSYCRVSQDGRLPQRYLRFDTTKVGQGRGPNGTPAPAPAPTPTPKKENNMAVTPVITNYKPSQQDVFQINSGNLYHKWRDASGKWNNELVAGPAGGLSKVATSFPDQTPQVTVSGGQILVTVEDSRGFAFYFAQSANASGWGANQLP